MNNVQTFSYFFIEKAYLVLLVLKRECMLRERLNITAHSGCDGTLQDTIESVLAGVKHGADAVEVDVRANARGKLILSHDKDPNVLYQGHPLLEDVFTIVAGESSPGVNCDVKEPETIPAILQLARQKNVPPEKLILSGSARPSMLEKNPSISTSAQVWLNVEEIIEDYYRTGASVMEPYRHLVDPQSRRHEILKALAPKFEDFLVPMIGDCKRLGVKAINMPYTELTRSIMSRIISLGIQVSVWTINDEDKMRELFGLGVINVTTRNTRLAVEVRDSLNPAK